MTVALPAAPARLVAWRPRKSGSPQRTEAQRVTGQAVFSATATTILRRQGGCTTTWRGQGLSVFFDKTELHAGDRWLDRLQDAVDGCGAFVVLVGRDGVARWVGAETQAALNRHFGARG